MEDRFMSKLNPVRSFCKRTLSDPGKSLCLKFEFEVNGQKNFNFVLFLLAFSVSILMFCQVNCIQNLEDDH